MGTLRGVANKENEIGSPGGDTQQSAVATVDTKKQPGKRKSVSDSSSKKYIKTDEADRSMEKKTSHSPDNEASQSECHLKDEDLNFDLLDEEDSVSSPSNCPSEFET